MRRLVSSNYWEIEVPIRVNPTVDGGRSAADRTHSYSPCDGPVALKRISSESRSIEKQSQEDDQQYHRVSSEGAVLLSITVMRIVI